MIQNTQKTVFYHGFGMLKLNLETFFQVRIQIDENQMLLPFEMIFSQLIKAVYTHYMVLKSLASKWILIEWLVRRWWILFALIYAILYVVMGRFWLIVSWWYNCTFLHDSNNAVSSLMPLANGENSKMMKFSTMMS